VAFQNVERRRQGLRVDSLVRAPYLRSKAITSHVFPNIYRLFLSPPEHNLCLDFAFIKKPKTGQASQKGDPCKTEA
jgi:hypothetical protein